MACPHVSGLAALIKSEYPSYTASEIESTIINNVVDLGPPGFDVYFGWGRISALNVFEVPNEPTNPSPSNGATGVNTSPTLSVDVTDPYGDSMSVSFYDASDDSLIGTDTGVPSGGTATVTWGSLSGGTVYSWYTVVTDGSLSTTSSTWAFATQYAPNTPTNPSPSNGASGITTNPTLNVDVSDPEGDSMSVSFYNGSDDSLIGIDAGIVSGGTASVSWNSLSNGTVYSWYAVANDGSTSTTSLTWTFTTNYAPNVPTNPNPTDYVYGVDLNPTLSVDVFDFDGDSMDVSFYNASDDSLIGTDTSVISGGTASISWSALNESTTYKWYAVASDGMFSTTSSTWFFTTNFPPDAPINSSPPDSATGININPILIVNVSDPDGDSMDVSFYDAFGNILIGTDSGVLTGEIASVPWLGLSYGTTYNWYVIIYDDLTSTNSSKWVFTTNYAPNIINNPSPTDGATGVNINPTLSVNVSDPDGDSMNVSFYDASDDSLIGTDTGVTSGGTASVLWDSLSEDTVYSWYAVANDGFTSTTSLTWSFTSILHIPMWDQTPTDQIIEYGHLLNYDINASDFSGINRYWLNDTINFNIDSIGIITSIGVLAIGDYIVEVRAYNPSDNYCTATINIAIEDTTSPTWDLALTDQSLDFGEALLYDLDAFDLSGISLYWINNTSYFNIDDNGLLTNITTLIPMTYWLEVRAYDPSDNYCTGFIKIVVNSPEEIADNFPLIIPGYNIFFLIGIIALISLIGIRNQIKKAH